MHRRLRNAAAGLATAAVVVGSRERQAHYRAENYVSRSKVVRIPFGVNLERFRPDPAARREVRQELGVADGELLVGAVGLAIWVEVFGPSVTAIVVMRMIWAVGMGLALPNSTVTAVGVNPATIGAGAALSGFLQTIGGVMGSAVNALFPAGDPLSLGLAFACTALFAACAR